VIAPLQCPSVTLYLEDKRIDLVSVVGKLQHVSAGFPLLAFGLKKLEAGEEVAIALVEVSVALIVIVAFAIEMRALRRKFANPGEHHDHPIVGWFDLAAAGLLFFEAFHGVHHKPGYLRPQFLSGVITLMMGLFHARLQHFSSRRRYLTIDDTGVDCRTSAIGRFGIAWADLASIELLDDRAVFHCKSGARHKLNLRMFRNGEKARDAIRTDARAAALLPPV
jgi:hypothetical protein